MGRCGREEISGRTGHACVITVDCVCGVDVGRVGVGGVDLPMPIVVVARRVRINLTLWTMGGGAERGSLLVSVRL